MSVRLAEPALHAADVQGHRRPDELRVSGVQSVEDDAVLIQGALAGVPAG